MRLWVKIAIVIALCASTAGVIAAKHARKAAVPETAPVAAERLPRLLEIGSTKCVPCKMMAPVLEELKSEYAGRLQVDFIDVWSDKSATAAYKIKAIPTQILFDAGGRELYRHEGFFPKEEILAKWRQLGVELVASPKPVQK
jgi:thioredoxin 1